jgi:iron complex outermembrane receptor protein
MLRTFLLAGAGSALIPFASLAAAAPQDAAGQSGDVTAPPPATPSPPAAVAAQRTQPAPPDQQEIVVTGTPLRTETPTIVARVNRDEIIQTGGGNVADALANVPGISSTGFAAGASRPIIRGMDATRVRILEDGNSSSDVSDIGPDHGVPIDPLAAQSIEVVRGAATLRYGSQAIGGVVNVLNNRVPTSLPTRSFSGEADGSYATNADIWQGALLADVRAGNAAFHADGFYRHAGDYDTPLGTQQNSFFRGYGGSLGGSLFFGSDAASHVGLAVQQYDAKYGVPSDVTFIDLRQTKLVERSSFALGSGVLKTLSVDGSYANYSHDEIDPSVGILDTFRNKELDSHAELLLGPIGFLHSSALGVQVQHRDFQALGDARAYIEPTTTQSEAAYAFTEVPVGNAFHLQASGRVERVHITGTPASGIFTRTDFTPVSGALGALLDAGEAVKLGVTFSSTGRAPAVTELFARGPHDGPGTFEIGDPTLQIERANSLEGTLRVHANRFRFEGSIYSSWFRNYIFGDFSGRTCDEAHNCVVGDGEEFRELFYRQQSAHFRGLEGQVNYAFISGRNGTLEARALGDYVRATLGDGSNVPRIPPYRIGGGLSWRSPTFDAGILFIRAGRQDRFGAFDTPTPGYNALSANIALRPFKAHPGIELAVVGQNLTNDVQRDAAALNKDVVVLPGRTVRFVLRVASF